VSAEGVKGHLESHRRGYEQVLGTAEHDNVIAGLIKETNHSESYLVRTVTALVQRCPLYPK